MLAFDIPILVSEICPLIVCTGRNNGFSHLRGTKVRDEKRHCVGSIERRLNFAWVVDDVVHAAELPQAAVPG